MIRGYNSYQGNENLLNALKEYSRETDKNKTQLYFSKKYNIPIATFKRYYKNYKTTKLNGGNLNDIIPPTKEQKNILKKKEQQKQKDLKKQQDGLKFMENMKGGRNNGKMDEFIKDNCNNKKNQEQKNDNQHKKPQNLFNVLNKLNPEFTKYD